MLLIVSAIVAYFNTVMGALFIYMTRPGESIMPGLVQLILSLTVLLGCGLAARKWMSGSGSEVENEGGIDHELP